jgi:hypothetical protein
MTRVEWKNQNGVQVYLASASKGVDVSLGRSGHGHETQVVNALATK